MSCAQLVKEIKVIGSFSGVTVNNALTFNSGLLQFGGPLVKDTDITANFALNFGTNTNRIRQFNVIASNQVSLEYNDGTHFTNMLFNATGIIVNNTLTNAKGIHGANDYSANYSDLTYIQKTYADKTLLGKSVTAALLNPTAPQNSFAITWNQAQQKFDLTPSGTITAGADTQVIYNSGGNLVGTPNFNFVSGVLSVPGINLGAFTALAGSDRTIQVISDQPDAGLILKSKGTGNLSLSLLQGKILLGDPTSTNTNHIITATGVGSQIDISLEPKGTEGVVYIGNQAEAGAYRYLYARGNNAHVGLYFKTKGTGNIVFDLALLSVVYIGNPNDSILSRTLKAGSAGISDLIIGGNGVTSKVIIGDISEAATLRLMQPGGSSSNVSLNIFGKGTGLVAVNNFINWKKIAIGDWNMRAAGGGTAAISVPHGLPDYTKIGVVYATIIADSGTNIYPINTTISTVAAAGSVQEITATHIVLGRIPGGSFDTTSFDATGFNRGWIYISYEL